MRTDKFFSTFIFWLAAIGTISFIGMSGLFVLREGLTIMGTTPAQNRLDITPVNTMEVPAPNRPEQFGFNWLVQSRGQTSRTFKGFSDILYGKPSEYSQVNGVTCFRGNNYRDSASFGTADIQSEKLEPVWSHSIGYIDTWTGVGWNGQPAIVRWDEEVKAGMNIFEYKKNKAGLKEVIYGALDGKVHFLDLDTGTPTRRPIKTSGPIKGSVTVDPRGYPLLYVGQGINTVGGKRVPIGYSIYSLLDQKRLHFINGIDSFALKRWGAFDSTALVHAKTDTLVVAGENGLVYTARLNSRYEPAKNELSISPEITRYRYHTSKSRKMGIENSPAVYRNYAYFADNDGVLQCLDLNTLSPVWVRDVTDDTDSTIVIDEKDNKVSLYTACEVDRRGADGLSYIRKLNALTGETLWERSFKCRYSQTNGGVLGTPVLGKNDIEHLVIFNIAKSYKQNGGRLTAFDKESGETVWELTFDRYSWSSPVDIYTPEGKSYIIFCDSGGSMYLIEGTTGKILDRINVRANVEGSPAVYNNMVVVGTRGQEILGVKVK